MKRGLLFALLLGLGFLLLRLAIGDEQFAQQRTDDGSATAPQVPATDHSQPLTRTADGTELQIRGGFVIAPYRSVPAPDGVGTDRQAIYELACRDCEPTDDGRHRLDEVKVKLFDRGQHAADLTASRALVELEVDGDNRRTLRENRELDLFDAVLETVPGARTPLRLEVGRVRALVDDDEIVLHTPDDRQPVTAVIGGPREGTLAGHGMRARMPRESGGGRFDLEILKDPTIRMSGVDLRAAGTLHYVEQLATGAALLTVENDVRVELDDRGDRQQLGVHGDRLHGWLQRGRSPRPGVTAAAGAGAGTAPVWTMLRLLGSRASVRTDAVLLESPRITVLPGPTGQLASLTADGGSSDLRQLDGDASFRSTRPIHLLRVRDSIGALHRTFGFPAGALGALGDLEIITFEGAAAVAAGDGVQVSARRGLHLFRRPGPGFRGQLVAKGFGDVTVEHGSGDERVVARGDHGFVLRRTSAGDEVVLGRDDPAARQTFAVERGPLLVQGTGSARVLRTGDDRVQLWLRSGANAIEGRYGRRGDPVQGFLRRAAALDATVAGRDLTEFVAAGDLTEVEAIERDRRLVATASRIERLDSPSLRLSGRPGTPARLHQPELGDDRTADLWAPTIDLHRIAGRDVLVDARGDERERARLSARLQDLVVAAGADPGFGALDAAADRIRLLPFAVGPRRLLQATIGFGGPLAEVVTGSLGRPWLLASGAVVADFRDRPQGKLHGEGALLATSLGAHGLLLVGDATHDAPAALERFEAGERTLLATGARVRFHRGDVDRITVLTTWPDRQRLVPPTVTFRSAQSPDDPLAWIRGECRGDIEVLPDAVLFRGPVEAHSLLPTGTSDPSGMQIEAEHLRMARQRDTGELTKVVADGGVRVRWRDLEAQSRHIELDLRWQRCTAEDPGDAVLRFAGGRTFRATRLEANYATYAVRSYHGSFVQEAAQAERR